MPTGEARALLREHAGREEAGLLDDPAVHASVVGVERLSLAAGTIDPEELRRLLDAPPPRLAELVAELVGRVDVGLGRRDHGRQADASLVNADAGHHAVVAEAPVLRAAVRAAHATWAANPYYEARYGARGARFASSDSAWLAGLVPLRAEEAISQTEWLARLLAARGMPSWLLERHLDDLAQELRDSLGEAGAGALPAAAASLRARRDEVAGDDLLAQADRWVAAEVGDDAPVARTGALLAAAHADVRSGLVPDDASLVDWLTDPDRVPPAAGAGIRRVRQRIAASVPADSPKHPR